jgi:excisionase family DNA binding protein
MKPHKLGRVSPSGSAPVAESALPIFFTIAAVATQLEVSQKTVRRLIDDGTLLTHRFGRLVRVSDADLRAFIARSRSDQTRNAKVRS